MKFLLRAILGSIPIGVYHIYLHARYNVCLYCGIVLMIDVAKERKREKS